MTSTPAIQAERARRDAMWRQLADLGAPDRATAEQVSQAGIRPLRTGHGIFRDQDATRHLAPDGVTLTLLDTGRVYADRFDENGGIYHYPRTDRGARDEGEIEATKNAKRFELPLFVVLRGESDALRRVRRGWIREWNDDDGTFLVTFDEEEARTPIAVPGPDDPFELRGRTRDVRQRTVIARPGQSRFAFEVFLRCGSACTFCDLRVRSLLEAAHVCPVGDGGTDDSRNGLVICRNHHRAFDLQLLAIEPGSLAVMTRPEGPSRDSLRATSMHVPIEIAPHESAIAWRWERFVKRETVGER